MRGCAASPLPLPLPPPLLLLVLVLGCSPAMLLEIKFTVLSATWTESCSDAWGSGANASRQQMAAAAVASGSCASSAPNPFGASK